MEFTDVDKVVITPSRWNVYIDIHTEDSIEHYVASADSGVTYGDGIYFGTREEFDENMDDAW